MARVAVRIKVTGIVHGVSFRSSTASVASSFGVSGWVRNIADGSVEAHLEGDEAAVAKVVEWARRGPPMARVSKLEATRAVPKGSRGFRVLTGSEAF